MNLINSYGLFLGNRQPTRGDHCLDTVVTNLPSRDYSVNIVDPLVADADHCDVLMSVTADLVNVQSNISDRPTWHKNYLFSRTIVDDDNIKLFRAYSYFGQY